MSNFINYNAQAHIDELTRQAEQWRLMRQAKDARKAARGPRLPRLHVTWHLAVRKVARG